MSEIDDLKAVADQLLIQQAYLTVKLDAVASLLHTSVIQNSGLSALRDHFDLLEHALNQSIDAMLSSEILFSTHHAPRMKLDVLEEMNTLRRKYGLSTV